MCMISNFCAIIIIYHHLPFSLSLICLVYAVQDTGHATKNRNKNTLISEWLALPLNMHMALTALTRQRLIGRPTATGASFTHMHTITYDHYVYNITHTKVCALPPGRVTDTTPRHDDEYVIYAFSTSMPVGSPSTQWCLLIPTR